MRERRILAHFYLLGENCSQIGKILKLPYNSVQWSRQKAIEKLIKFIPSLLRKKMLTQ